MPMFKDPYSKRYYNFQEYDDEYVIPNEKTQDKVDTQFNHSELSNRGWNRNHFSTRKKVYRDVVVKKDWMVARAKQHKDKIKPRKWYNW